MIKVPALSDNYRSLKADLYNTEETNEGPCRSKRLAFSLQSDLGYEYEINMISSLPIHSMSNKTCHRDRIARLTAPCPSHKKL